MCTPANWQVNDIIIKHLGDSIRKEQFHLEDARDVRVREINPPLKAEMAVSSGLIEALGNVLSKIH